MTGFAFAAFGTPGPQGSKIRTKFAMRESSDKVAPWREAVKAAAPSIEAPLDGPLVVRMIFTLARPKSARKTDVAPYRTPDISKLARSTEDAITDVGLWADDARVVGYDGLWKVWWGYAVEALPVPGVIVACCGLDDWLSSPTPILQKMSRDTCFEAIRRLRGVAPTDDEKGAA